MKPVQSFPRRRWLPILLVVFQLAESCAFAGPKTAAHAKAQAAAVGIGHKAVVTLANGSEVKGTIIAMDADSFTIDKGKSKGTSQLAYADVRQILRDGMSRKEKAVAITAAAVIVVGIGVLIAGTAWSRSLCNQTCPSGSASLCTCTSSLDRPNPTH
jgi:hypothetical protein